MTRTTFVARLDRAFYPGLTRTWDSSRYRDHLLSYINASHSVLDVGAGRGRDPEMNFRGVAAKVTGVDLDPCVMDNPYLDHAVVQERSTDEFPFPDASFDVVMTSNVLEHVDAPELLFREVWRVLRPGGHFISKTPNRGHYVALIASVTPHVFHEWVNVRRGRNSVDTYPTHYRANSRAEISRLAARAPFDVVSLMTWEGPPNYLRLVPPIYPLGILYERVVNATDRFADYRAVLVATLRKRA